MARLWRAATDRHHDELYFSYTGVTLGSAPEAIPFPIRAYRTRRYKHIRNINYRVGHPKRGGIRLPYEELHDLETDPGESDNLAGKPKLATIQEQLSAKVDVWMEKTNDQGIRSERESLRRYQVER